MRIIVAEDNDILRKSLSFFLESKGFNVDQFSDGKDALDAIETNSYDLILTDINMPGISGMEITQYVRQTLNSDIPIIILTSSGVEQTELDSFDIKKLQNISAFLKREESYDLAAGFPKTSKIVHWVASATVQAYLEEDINFFDGLEHNIEQSIW